MRRAVPRWFHAKLPTVSVLVCLLITCSWSLTYDHPDSPGLLALKASICGKDCPALTSWNETSSVCQGFEGVGCAFIDGSWRAVSVHLQLEKAAVSFNDSQLVVGGALQGVQHLTELEVLCFKNVVAEAALYDHQQQQHLLPAIQTSQAIGSLPVGPAHHHLHFLDSIPSSAEGSISTSSLHSCNGSSTSASEASSNPASTTQQQSAAAAAAFGDLPSRWFLAYPRLQQLRVSGCGATGQLPAELFTVKQLSSLVLPRNKISGTLPEELVQLQHLNLLDLSGNSLSGTLPAAWSRLPQLSYLYLNQNNLSLDVLPCEWASMLSLKLADLSGNRQKPRGIATAAAAAHNTLGCWSRSQTAVAAAAVLADQLVSSQDSSSSSRGLSTSSGRSSESSTSRSSSVGRPLGTVVNAIKSSGVWGPRCWLRRFCYDEGAFICLQRNPKHPSGGCTSYIYGASDLHIDPANQCDHGGVHLMAVSCLWIGLIVVLLLIWLHHCRVLRRMTDPGHQRQQQWQQQPHQRQWLVTSGPAASPRVGLGVATGADAFRNEGTLPLLYYPAASHEDGAGYVRPASPGACSMDRAMSDSDALPSALNTPPITTTRVMVVRGFGSAASSGYESDHSASSGAQGVSRFGGSGLRGAAGGTGKASPGFLGGRGDSSSSSSSCFSTELLLPLAFALLDVTTDVRLLLLWGIWPNEVKLWPSYTLLGFILVPHVLVGAVVHFRLLAAACLPPAVQAASPPMEADILPPGSKAIILLYSWLFSAPWWLAYPLILVLLLPGVALLAVLCPLTLLLHAFGASSHAAVVRYVQLLQACIALTESSGTAVLLTVLFLMGNMPLEYAFLDGSLYYLNLVASMMDIAAAWWIKLDGVRRQQLVQMTIPPAGIWS